MNNNIQEGYVNEGFLFINNNKDESENKTFEIGKIIDIECKIVCLGEIVFNNSRKDFLDFVKCKSITHYSPLYKGIKIRIYWYDEHFIISTINEIYSEIDISGENTKYINQINFDLLDKNIIYYATITKENTIILTYMVEITNKMKKNKIPILNIPKLSEDLAFENHLEIFDCQYPFLILDKIEMQINGLIFYSNCGVWFEFCK